MNPGDWHSWNKTVQWCEKCGISGVEYATLGGQFCVYSCCGGKGIIRWRDSEKKWICTDCGASKSSDPNYYWTPKSSDTVGPIARTNSNIKCECGADATYGPGNGMHSATMPCPMYRKN